MFVSGVGDIAGGVIAVGVISSVVFGLVFPVITLSTGWIWPIAAGAIGLGVSFFLGSSLIQFIAELCSNRSTSGVGILVDALLGVSLVAAGILLAIFPVFPFLVTLGIVTATIVPLTLGIPWIVEKARSSTTRSAAEPAQRPHVPVAQEDAAPEARIQNRDNLREATQTPGSPSAAAEDQPASRAQDPQDADVSAPNSPHSRRRA